MCKYATNVTHVGVPLFIQTSTASDRRSDVVTVDHHAVQANWRNPGTSSENGICTRTISECMLYVNFYTVSFCNESTRFVLVVNLIHIVWLCTINLYIDSTCQESVPLKQHT